MGGSSKGLAPAHRRIRRCVGCGRELSKDCMLRVVRSPSGEVSVNAAGKAPGRGAYICADSACVRMAMKKNALARALKHPVDKELYARLEEMCVERG
ncbi:MAG: YlxR family protein [Synergistaceae bacterium]|nr:YlxR family protein [Synergistaceae bacterium]